VNCKSDALALASSDTLTPHECAVGVVLNRRLGVAKRGSDRQHPSQRQMWQQRPAEETTQHREQNGDCCKQMVDMMNMLL